jgi:hypothetical protein
MTISYIGPTQPVTGQTPTVNIPTGVVEGDLLILVINGQDLYPAGGELPAPPGWSVRFNDFGPLHVYYKFASSSETPVTLNLNNTATCNILAYRNAKMSTSGWSAVETDPGTEITTTGQGTNTKYNFILRFYSCGSGNVTSFTVPEFTTARINFSSTLTNRGMLLTDEFQSEIATAPGRTTIVSTEQAFGIPHSYTFTIEPKDTLNPGINFIGSGSVVTGASPTLNVPAGVIAGDTLIILSSTTVDPTTPTGWTVKSFVSGSFRIYMAIKTATSSESSVTLNGLSADATSVMLAYSGVDPSKTGNTVRNNFGTVMESPSEGTSSKNSYIFRAWVCDSGGNTEFEIVNLSSSRLNSRINFSGALTTRGLVSTDELQDDSGAVPERITFLSTDRSWTALVWPMEPKRNLYWVGGSGTWDTSSATNWSLTSGGNGGEALPTSDDNVIIDINSGSPTITLSGSLSCASLTTTGATCTLTSTGTLTISEGITLSATTTWSATGLLTLNGTGTVTTNGVSISSSITIDAAGSTITLGDELTTTGIGILTLTAGTLNLNGNDLTCSIFDSNTDNIRSILFGSNFINVTGLSNPGNDGGVYMPNIANFFNTGTGGFKVMVSPLSTSVGVYMGNSSGNEYGANGANVWITGGFEDPLDGLSIDGGSTIKSLNFTGYTGTWYLQNQIRLWGSLTLSPTMNILDTLDNSSIEFRSTIPGNTITTAGLSINLVFFNGVGGSWTLQDPLDVKRTIVLTAGTLNLNGFDASCLTFSSNNANTRSITFGSNWINITSTVTGTVLNMTNMNSFTKLGTGGFKLTGVAAIGTTRTANIGTTYSGRVNDAAPSVWVSAGAGTFAMPTDSKVEDLIFTGFGGSYAPAAILTIVGGLTAAANMTWITGTGQITFGAVGDARNITTAGKTLYSIRFLASATSVLQDTLTCSNTVELVFGTVILNGFDINCLSFSANLSTSARSIVFGNNYVNLTSTSTGTVLNLTNSTRFTSTGAGGFRLTGNAASGTTRTVVIGTTGGSVETSPNVFVAGGAVGSIVAITNNSWVRDLNFTGFSGTFTPSTNTYNIAGSFTLSDAMLYTINDNTTYNFVATTTGHTIHLASPVRQIGNVVFNGVGGEWTMLTLLRCTESNITLTSGTLNLNNNGTTCRTWTCTGTGVRSIAFGSSGIVEAAGLGTITSINFANLTNFSYTGTSRIFVAGNSTGTSTINIGTTGGNETNAMNVQIAFGSGGRIFTFTNGSVIRDLNVVSLTGGTFAPPSTLTIFGSLIASANGTWTTGTGTITFASTSPGRTITTAGKALYNVTFNGAGGAWTMQDAFTASNTVNFINGTINLAANTTSTIKTFATSGTTLKYLASSIPGSQATILQSSGTVTVTYLSIKDSNATGGATFDALSLTNINAGNNTGWLFGITPNYKISYIGSSPVVTGPNPTLIIPAGVVEGDLLIIVSGTKELNSSLQGWQVNSIDGGFNFLIARKFASNSESPVSLSLSNTAKSVMLAYRGVAPLTSAVSQIGYGSNVSTLDSSLVVNTPNSYVLRFWRCDAGVDNPNGIVNSDTTFTVSNFTTARVNSSGTRDFMGLLLTDELQTETGIVPIRTSTYSNEQFWTTWATVLTPKPEPTPSDYLQIDEVTISPGITIG